MAPTTRRDPRRLPLQRLRRPETALAEPFDILEEAADTYLIADRAANTVYRLREGELQTVVELPGPRDLEPTPDGRVLVASGRDVIALDPGTGATETVATARGDVLGVARLSGGAIAVSEDGSRVVRFDDGRRRVLATGLDAAHGLLDTEAGLVVCDSGHGRVLLLARNGRRRVLADGLELPSFAAAAGDGALYVSDFGAGSVVRIERSGAIEPIAEVAQPTALSVARDGSVLITSLGGAVSRVDPETGSVEPLE